MLKPFNVEIMERNITEIIKIATIAMMIAILICFIVY
jgi:hypothetical protein